MSVPDVDRSFPPYHLGHGGLSTAGRAARIEDWSVRVLESRPASVYLGVR